MPPKGKKGQPDKAKSGEEERDEPLQAVVRLLAYVRSRRPLLSFSRYLQIRSRRASAHLHLNDRGSVFPAFFLLAKR